MSRSWSDSTKRWAVVGIAVLALLTLLLVAHVLPPFVAAAVLAYLLSPVVGALQRMTRLPRILAVAGVYLGLVALVILIPVVAAPGMLEAVRNVDVDRQTITRAVVRFAAANRVIVIFGTQVDLSPISERILEAIGTTAAISTEETIQSVWRSLPAFFGLTSRFATGFASSLIQIILSLVASFYLVHDAPAIGRYLDGLVPEVYRGEITDVRAEIGAIWDGFFRGQILLCVVVGAATGVALWLLGVRSAFTLGLLAGILEIVPNIGPVLSAVPAVILAFVQGSSHLPISNLWFGLLVILAYVVIQQVENHFLVPRIIGGSVNLHPVVVLFGVVAGASIAGILGILLAAPVMGTIRVIGQYVVGKILDTPVELVATAEDVTAASAPVRPAAAGPEQPATLSSAPTAASPSEIGSLEG